MKELCDKLLEITKLNAGQLLAITFSCLIIFLLIKNDFILLGEEYNLIVAIIIFIGITSFFLFLNSIVIFFNVPQNIKVFLSNRKLRKSVENYIPHMTERDKEIISYLIERNQKTFTADIDGGYASVLLSKGI